MKFHFIFKTSVLFVLLIAMLAGVMPVLAAFAEGSVSPLQADGDFISALHAVSCTSNPETGFPPSESINDQSTSDNYIYTVGQFSGICDFDPGPDTFNLTAALSANYISKLDLDGNLIWAKGIGERREAGIAHFLIRSMVIDSSDNIYLIGSFDSTHDFDPGPNTFNLTSVGTTDLFVSKFDSDGNFIWAKSVGGVSTVVYSTSITVDLHGNVYFTGYFTQTVDFDPGSGSYDVTSSDGNFDPFISKLDGNGNFLWVKTLSTAPANNIYIGTVRINSEENLILVGTFRGTADLDPGSGIFELTSASAGDSDVFISTLDSSGNFLWSKGYGAYGLETAILDSSDNIYVTGWIRDAIQTDHKVTSYDSSIVKLDRNGSLIWIKILGASYSDTRVWDIAVDSIGNVYTTGGFSNTVDFDPGPGIFNLTAMTTTPFWTDMFISKLDRHGDFVWAKSLAPPIGAGIVINPQGRVITGGVFGGTTDFDPGPAISNLADGGVFILQLDLHTFADIAPDYWARTWIERLYNSELTSGCSVTPLMYCPEVPVTRAQMAVFLLRGMHGSSYSPPAVAGNTGFGDVPADYWSAEWIKELAAEGITGGCGSGNYCPEYPVTRDQMAVFLLKARHGTDYLPPTAMGVFGDVPTDYWAADWIEQLAAEGITAGCGNGNYCPTTSVTRDQMAVFLVKTFNLP